MLARFNIERKNIANLSTVCPNCDYISAIFFSTCKKCHSKLVPLEIQNYYKFKRFYSGIKERLSIIEDILNSYMERLTVNIKNAFSQDFIKKYIGFSFNDYFYKVFLSYFQNLKEILKRDYIYGYIGVKDEELPWISKKITKYAHKKEQISSQIRNVSDLRMKEVLYDAILILELFSQECFKSSESDEEIHFIDGLFFDTLNQLISLIKSKFREFNQKDFEYIVKFRKIINDFISEKNKNYIEDSGNFIEFIPQNTFLNIIIENNLDFVFLPASDIYVLVKKDYTPDLDEILSMNEEIGGVNIRNLSERFKISIIEAEVIIQILIRRKLVAHTSSYLNGKRYYLR